MRIRENRRGKSKMDNPDTLSTFGTQDRGRRQTNQQQNLHHRELKGRAIWTPLLCVCIPEITVLVMGRFTKSEISMVIFFLIVQSVY